MTVAQAYRQGAAKLEQSGASDARVNAGWLLATLTGEMRLSLPICTREMDAELLARYDAGIARMAQGEPLQYVLGTQEFMGCDFRVDARVLIPREDTATLVECAARHIGERRLRVLDIGTGSGAIAIMLSRLCKNAQVTAVDISGDALAVAQENARNLGAQVRFVQSDLMSALVGERFDVIVSNPPYIRSQEIDTLAREVRKEPHCALDGGADGLDFYKRIVPAVGDFLTPGGMLCFEVGYDQARDVRVLMDAQGFMKTGTRYDLNGIERVVYGYWGME